MIYLREISEDDLVYINKFRNNKDLQSFLVAPFRYINIETDKKWLSSYQNNRNNNIRCVICHENDTNILGVVYLLDIDWINRTANFGIFISSESMRGKGYGKYATKLMLEHAFYNMNLNRVQLRVLEKNDRAIKLYKNVGFIEEGILRDAVFKENCYQNLVVMGILRSDFIGK